MTRSNESDPLEVLNELIGTLRENLKVADDFDERQKLTHQLLQAIGMHQKLQPKTKGKGFNF